MTQLCRWRIDLALELSSYRDFLPRFCDMNGLQPRGDMMRMCKMCSPAGREVIVGLDSSEAEGPPGVGALLYYAFTKLLLLTACILLFFRPGLFQYFALSGTTFLS